MYHAPEMSPEELTDIFPEQMFPEVEDIEVTLNPDSLVISGTETVWPMDSGIILASGDGSMSFAFTGNARITITSTTGEDLEQPVDEWLGKQVSGVAFIRLIRRADPWEFVFGSEDGAKLTIAVNVTLVTWDQ